MRLIRKSELARIRGVTPAAITHAIRSGRIRDAVVTRNGKEYIDHDLAMELWERNTINDDPPPPRRPAAVPDAADRDELRAIIDAIPDDEIPDINDSRKRRIYYQAEKEKHDALQRRGELVPITEVRREASRLGRQVRDLLLIIPARNAAKLCTMQDQEDIRLLLQVEIESALRGLGNA
jgi:hypothetical protein